MKKVNRKRIKKRAKRFWKIHPYSRYDYTIYIMWPCDNARHLIKTASLISKHFKK